MIPSNCVATLVLLRFAGGGVDWALNDLRSVPWKDQREQQQLRMERAEPRLQGWKELGLFCQG